MRVEMRSMLVFRQSSLRARYEGEVGKRAEAEGRGLWTDGKSFVGAAQGRISEIFRILGDSEF